MVIALSRPDLLEARPTWGGGKVNATTVLLEPLTDGDSEALVANLLGSAERLRGREGPHHRGGRREPVLRRGDRVDADRRRPPGPRRRIVASPPPTCRTWRCRPRSPRSSPPGWIGWSRRSAQMIELASVIGGTFSVDAVEALTTTPTTGWRTSPSSALARPQGAAAARTRRRGRRRPLPVPAHPDPRRRVRGDPEAAPVRPARAVRRLARRRGRARASRSTRRSSATTSSRRIGTCVELGPADEHARRRWPVARAPGSRSPDGRAAARGDMAASVGLLRRAARLLPADEPLRLETLMAAARQPAAGGRHRTVGTGARRAVGGGQGGERPRVRGARAAGADLAALPHGSAGHDDRRAADRRRRDHRPVRGDGRRRRGRPGARAPGHHPLADGQRERHARRVRTRAAAGGGGRRAARRHRGRLLRGPGARPGDDAVLAGADAAGRARRRAGGRRHRAIGGALGDRDAAVDARTVRRGARAHGDRARDVPGARPAPAPRRRRRDLGPDRLGRGQAGGCRARDPRGLRVLPRTGRRGQRHARRRPTSRRSCASSGATTKRPIWPTRCAPKPGRTTWSPRSDGDASARGSSRSEERTARPRSWSGRRSRWWSRPSSSACRATCWSISRRCWPTPDDPRRRPHRSRTRSSAAAGRKTSWASPAPRSASRC